MPLDDSIDKAKDSAGNLADKAKDSASTLKEKAIDKFLKLKENFLGEEQKEIEEEYKDNYSSKLKDTI